MHDELRRLLRAGLVQRTERSARPVHVEYGLTPRGAALHAALRPLDAWAAR
jgi:DNA-binding HxlR family transcriptional regulator